ncbi:cytochrome P450 [Catenulispora yoronensis]|uniref:Cytochrome P450 n=1 Tax=Catenulispora yoronensis TaxID=450799 RepID=A0ABN2USD5_9ACTN
MTRYQQGETEPVDLADQDFLRDPFSAYARIRERAAMVRGILPGTEPWWIATRYEDVRALMKDPRFVNNAANVPGVPPRPGIDRRRLAGGVPADYLKYLQAGMPGLDGADHERVRRLVAGAFTARRVAGLRPRIEAVVGALLDRLPDAADSGVVDLLAHFAYPLPLTVICELVGVPEADRGRWREWSARLSAGAGDAVVGMVDYTHALVERRRSAPRDDLVSALVRARDADGDGDRLSDTELVTLVLSLVVAGHESSAHLIGNGIAALLAHPDQLSLLRTRPELLPDAVDELLRWCGPVVAAFNRYATQDVAFGGVTVRRGESVLPAVVAANHDPRRFRAPEALDIRRETGSRREAHLGFGHGPHYCLGAPLARLEGEVALGALWDRFPDLALAVAPGELRRVPMNGAWRLVSLPVRISGGSPPAAAPANATSAATSAASGVPE